ncbi:hypothetical protein GOP47_0021695 [Adiantum capillus-veneris]|uniref:Growth-regulating factor n=1 Tax=Adiantum capillus-veneris TaxID=13818 RepID=A0A9D4U7Z2_ADICA|nr:hypothetical protein GOP47_0021695 [Adiantum capillus-veneris]
MDSEARAADRLSTADDLAGLNSSCKLARTDTFPFRMQFPNQDLRVSLVRCNSSSVLPDCRLGCNSSSSTTPACSSVNSHSLLISGDPSYVTDARSLRNESLISASRALALQQQQQALSYKSSAALLSAYGEVERGGGAAMLQQQPMVVFTPSQLRELQLHALIFKHMVCGVNVPPELVLLVRTSVASLAGMTTGAAHLGSLGWGNYHLGYGNSVDPEPGRCRRTDGKKWRCARDVVPDQKYCERHMHRGRHRARKPPESLSSPAASASASPASSTVTALPRSAVGTPSSSPTTSFLSASRSPTAIASPFHLQQQHQLALQAARSLNNEDQTLLSDSRGLNQGPSPAVSGLSVVTSALSSPLDAVPTRPHSFLGAGVYESTGAGLSGREPEGQPLRHFFDDWPRGRDPASLTWPDIEAEQQRSSSSYGGRSLSKMQLSISIPSMQADFATNGGTPRGGKLALSPLKLSMSRGEEDPLGVEVATQMGLGVGLGVNETERQRQSSSSWVPIAWETTSVGGPLAEVLQSSSNTPREGEGGSHGGRGSGLNLMPDAWESSPRSSPPTSSPTGVLQINATFGCFSSDNSTASSPRLAALNKQPPEPTI